MGLNLVRQKKEQRRRGPVRTPSVTIMVHLDRPECGTVNRYVGRFIRTLTVRTTEFLGS